MSSATVKAPTPPWKSMKSAPKGATKSNPCKEHWILGRNKFGQCAVIRWCLEYPRTDGCWMFAYNGDMGIQEFTPVEWMDLPK